MILKHLRIVKKENPSGHESAFLIWMGSKEAVFYPSDLTRKPFITGVKYVKESTVPVRPNGGKYVDNFLKHNPGFFWREKDLVKTLMTEHNLGDALKEMYKPNQQEEKRMINNTKTKSTIGTVKDRNVEAVKLTAKIAAGKALNCTVQEKIVPKLPLMVRGYANTEVGQVVLANVVAAALTYYAPSDERAKMVSEAMIQASMLDMMASFDIEGLVKDFLSSDAAVTILAQD